MITHELRVTHEGELALPLTAETRGFEGEGDELLLICMYPEGDIDMCPFPFRNDEDRKRLIRALYDEGNLDRVKPGMVLLPNGEIFGQIVPGGFKPFHPQAVKEPH